MPNIEIKQKVSLKIIPAAIMVAGVALLVGLLLFGLAVFKKQTPSVTPSASVAKQKELIEPGKIIIRLRDNVQVTPVGKSKPDSTKTIDVGRKRILSPSLAALNTKHAIKKTTPLLHATSDKFGTLPDRLLVLEYDPARESGILLLDDYRKSPDILYAQPNYLYYASSVADPDLLLVRNDISDPEPGGGGSPSENIPNDPYLFSSGSWGQQEKDLWGLWKIQATDAWKRTKGSPETVIAVSDTGVDYSLPEIAANIWNNTDEIPGNNIDDDHNGYVDDWNGFDVVHARYDSSAGLWYNDSDGPKDDHYHGTHVAGTIAAVTNNGIGIAGVCWYCKIMPVKGLTYGGSGTSEWLSRTIEYATENGADVINMSWGGSGTDQAIGDALHAAYDAGVVLVVAAGNDSSDARGFFPANSPYVITVAASRPTDDLAVFSNMGPKIDVAAPGGGPGVADQEIDNILSLKPKALVSAPGIVGGDYIRLAGTSMAAPHVSGVAGLIRSLHSTLDPESVRSILRQSATDANAASQPGWDTQLGAGILNAGAATMIDAPLTAIITSPEENAGLTGDTMLDIRGTAAGQDATHYTVDYSSVATLHWEQIGSGSAPLNDNLLTQWHVPTNIRGQYIIRLSVFNAAGQRLDAVRNVLLGMHAGWPKLGGPQRANPLAVGDLDPSYPGLEIVFGSDNFIRDSYSQALYQFSAYHHDGTPVPNWNENVMSNEIIYKPVIADMDPALPGQEVVTYDIWGVASVQDRNGNVLGSEMAGRAWMRSNAPIVADVTTNSGLELVFGGGTNQITDPGQVVVTDSHARVLQNRGVRTANWRLSAPTVADLDGDGQPEILAADVGGAFYVWRWNGSAYALMPSWPFKPVSCAVKTAATVANIDHQGGPEIILANMCGQIYVLRSNGTVYPGWPKNIDGYNAESITVADIDYTTPGLEMIVGDYNQGLVYAFHTDGSSVSGFPVNIQASTYESPLVVQLDPSTPEPEILVVRYSRLSAFSSHGIALPEWDLDFGGVIWGVMVRDVDDDGLLELLVNSGNAVDIVDLPVPAQETATPWSEMHGTSTNNAVFATCSQNLLPGACSVTPQYCSGFGVETPSCGAPHQCGCPAQNRCETNGTCTPICSDGTPRVTCTSVPGGYCGKNLDLIHLSSQCASEDHVAHTNDDCNFCGADVGTYCSIDDTCQTPQPNRGLLGDYYQGANFDTLANADVHDAVIDFGPPYYTGNTYFADLANRPERANTNGPFSVRWDGYVNIPSGASITYYLNCYDSCRLFVGDLTTPLLNIPSGGWTASATRALPAGWRPIRVEYQNPGHNSMMGGTGLQLGWKINGKPYNEEIGTWGVSYNLILPHAALSPVLPGKSSGGQSSVTE